MQTHSNKENKSTSTRNELSKKQAPPLADENKLIEADIQKKIGTQSESDFLEYDELDYESQQELERREYDSYDFHPAPSDDERYKADNAIAIMMEQQIKKQMQEKKEALNEYKKLKESENKKHESNLRNYFQQQRKLQQEEKCFAMDDEFSPKDIRSNPTLFTDAKTLKGELDEFQSKQDLESYAQENN